MDDNNNTNNTVNGSTAATDNDNDNDIINSSYEFLLRPFRTGGKKIVFFGDSTTLHLFYTITKLFDLYYDKNNHNHKGEVEVEVEVEVEAEGWKESNNNNNTIITNNNIIHVNNVLELQRQLVLGMSIGKKETNVTGIRLV